MYMVYMWDLAFGFVVAIVISELLIHISDKTRIFYDSQAHAGDLPSLMLIPSIKIRS